MRSSWTLVAITFAACTGARLGGEAATSTSGAGGASASSSNSSNASGAMASSGMGGASASSATSATGGSATSSAASSSSASGGGPGSHHYVFVTTQAVSGDFRSKLPNLCLQEVQAKNAMAAGMTWQPVVAIDAMGAHFTPTGDVCLLHDGTATPSTKLVANKFAWWSTKHDVAIDRDAAGALWNMVNVWSGLAEDGTAAPTLSCSYFTTNDPAYAGTVGNTTGQQSWNNYGTLDCLEAFRVYCVGTPK